MAILIFDLDCIAEIYRLWPGLDDERTTEVWDGLTVLTPKPDAEHHDVVGGLFGVFDASIRARFLGIASAGATLSDRTPDWRGNYVNPDAVVFLNANPAVNHDTHWVGGPDLAVEVVSPCETPLAKFAFYAAVGTKELLLVHRDPWKLELFCLIEGKLRLAGASPAAVTSAALGLRFRLVEGTPRPRIAVTHPATGGAWSV